MEIIQKIKKKAQNQFQHLKFDKQSHTYWINGVKKPSTSKLISNLYPKFDAGQVSYYSARKQKRSREEVLLEWKEKNDKAIALGNAVHDFAEDYLLGRSYNKNLLPQQEAVIRFWQDLPSYYKLVFVELQMYNDVYTGTTDFVLLDTRDNTLVPGDWKTNQNLFKNHNDIHMHEPFNYLLDCAYNHYQLQLSFYQNLLTQVHPVSDRMLVHLPHEGGYKIYKPKNFTKQLKQYINEEYRGYPKSAKSVF